MSPRLTAICVFITTLASCAIVDRPDNEAPEPAAAFSGGGLAGSEEQQADTYRPFAEQELYNLLLAEFAVTRQELPLALEKYLAEAYTSRDATVAERAARIALYLRDQPAALGAAELWYSLDPEDEKASQIVVELLARTGRPGDALVIIRRQLESGQAGNVKAINVASFGEGNHSIDAVVSELESLHQEYPGNIEVMDVLARQLLRTGQAETALTVAQTMLSGEELTAQSAMLLAQIHEELDEFPQAATIIKRFLNDHPDNQRFHVYHAQLLSRYDLYASQKSFTRLLHESPDNADLIFALAAVAHQNNDDETASIALNRLLELNKKTSAAQYYLGLIAERHGHPDVALERYRAVAPGQYFVSAVSTAAELLVGPGEDISALANARVFLADYRQQYPQLVPTLTIIESSLLKEHDHAPLAHDLLSESLLEYPDEKHLRLERSLLSEHLDEVDLAIADLEYILEREPDDAMTLNALGYTLADRTDRYDEAKVLIEKAYAQHSDDAAIIDSLGWVQFKLGQIQQALKNLERAFSLSTDEEIVSHLVEVLLATEDRKARKRARKIVKRIRSEQEDTPLLDATLIRLQFDVR